MKQADQDQIDAIVREFGVSRETSERLGVFADLLRRWNSTVNLVSQADLGHLWQRHIADSLQLVPLLPNDITHLTDMGSGGGFPGLVLSIASGVHAHLIEADHRKAAFLREAAREAAASVTVHASRIERAHPPPAPVVTARALAPVAQLLDLAEPLLLPDGHCIFPKGAQVESELTVAARRWHMKIRRTPSRTSAGGTIVQISEIHRVRLRR